MSSVVVHQGRKGGRLQMSTVVVQTVSAALWSTSCALQVNKSGGASRERVIVVHEPHIAVCW